MSPTADDLVARSRRHIGRTRPEQLADVSAVGGLIVDIRPAAQRSDQGELPGAVVVERNVLEWRLDPIGSHRLPQVTGFDQPVVVVCSEGFASSLAADSLRILGYRQVTDLVGGYRAWSAWAQGSPDPSPGSEQADPSALSSR
jgi:rhodanese-related sulfurtransferase